MTREIKFRGWDTEYREWRDDFAILPTGQVLDVDGKAAPTIVLMQFTGLKDKNGKEIYKGDVLLYNDTESEYVDVGVGGQGVKVAEQEVNSFAFVDWKEGEFGITADSHYGETLQNKHWYPLVTLVKEEVEWVEVIGNIYENTELLK